MLLVDDDAEVERRRVEVERRLGYRVDQTHWHEVSG
jgi:hypothetical protein